MVTRSATLLVIRGNSGSGKSTVAREVRRRYGRGMAVLGQDELRREILREHGGLGDAAVAPGFIAASARYLLAAGYHVIVEGILHSGSHAAVLRQLIVEHPGPAHVFFLDVSFDKTVRRHHSRPEPIPVTTSQMRDWYAGVDVLGVDGEVVIGESSTLEETVATILDVSVLAGSAPLTPCPVRCPRCAQKRQRLTEAPAWRCWPGVTGVRHADRADDVETIGDVERLMGLGGPYVRARGASDYWLYATLFASTCQSALDDGVLVGAVVAMRSQDEPGDVYVQDVMVHPEHRRRGIAATLIGVVAGQAQRWGARRLYLTSAPDNTAPDATWRRLGFINLPGDTTVDGVHVVADCKGPGRDRAVYQLDL